MSNALHSYLNFVVRYFVTSMFVICIYLCVCCLTKISLIIFPVDLVFGSMRDIIIIILLSRYGVFAGVPMVE